MGKRKNHDAEENRQGSQQETEKHSSLLPQKITVKQMAAHAIRAVV